MQLTEHFKQELPSEAKGTGYSFVMEIQSPLSLERVGNRTEINAQKRLARKICLIRH